MFAVHNACMNPIRTDNAFFNQIQFNPARDGFCKLSIPQCYRMALLTALLSAILSIHPSNVLAAICPEYSASTSAEQTITLKFSDFFHMPIGPLGLVATDTLKHANGKRVCISGFMVKMESPAPGQLMLTPVPVEMSEHADGPADDLPVSTLTVYLDPAQKTWLVPQAKSQVIIEGVLSVGRKEAADGRVSWIQLQLTTPLPKTTFE